jgi:hypothetical protein
LLASHVVPQHLVGFAQVQEKISQRSIPCVCVCKCKRRSQLLRVQSHKSYTICQQLPRIWHSFVGKYSSTMEHLGYVIVYRMHLLL